MSFGVIKVLGTAEFPLGAQIDNNGEVDEIRGFSAWRFSSGKNDSAAMQFVSKLLENDICQLGVKKDEFVLTLEKIEDANFLDSVLFLFFGKQNSGATYW